MKSRKGLTLIEVILSIALLGIISVMLMPALTSQFAMMMKTRSMTEDLYSAQQNVEQRIASVKADIQSGTAPADQTRTSYVLFSGQASERTVYGYPNQIEVHVGNSAINLISVVADNRMPVFEVASLSNVGIQLSNGTTTLPFAYTDTSFLEVDSSYNILDTNNVNLTNISRWYVSRAGFNIPMTTNAPEIQKGTIYPRFPDDYSLILGATTENLTTILSTYAGRHLIYTLTPASTSGKMGDTVLSNAVFLSGLPVLANLKLHLDASMVSKEDSTAVRSVITTVNSEQVQNDFVLKWNDISGNSNNATQGTTTLQPELIEMKMGDFTFGERDYETYSKFIRFDGTKAMTVAQSTTLNLNNLTVIVVARSSSKDAQKTIVSKIGTGTVGWFVGWNTSNQLGWYIRNGGTTNTLSAAADVGLDGGWHILTGSASSSAVSFQSDDTTATSSTRTVSSTLSNTSPISIGYNGSSSFSTVDVAEILVYDGTLSVADMASVQTYLKNKYQPTPPVTSIYALKPMTETVALGETYTMPTTMQAYMTNGTLRDVAVDWSPTSIDTSTVGAKTSTATAVSDSSKSTTLTVDVLGIHSLEDLSFTVERGSTFTMPSTVVAILGDISGPKRNVAVTWNIDAVDTNTLGTVVRTGTAVLDSSKSMTLTVTVIPRKVTGVTLDTHASTMNIGSTVQLTATVLPTDAANKTVTWRSNNTAVATVSASGLVTAVGSGTASIIVTTVDGGLTDVCTVTVNIPVSSVSLNRTSITIPRSGTTTLVATVLPSNATNKTVVWTSSDTNIATVTSAGLVTVKSNATIGNATVITATSIDSGVTATCTVTAGTPVTGVSLNRTTRTIIKGSTYDLVETVDPWNATNTDVTWSSSDTDVATVSGNGRVTAVSGGTAIITVTTEDGGFTATCTVTVTVPVTGVTLSPTAITLPRSGTVDLTETVLPSDATNKNVTWFSSNTNVATVSTTGVVTVKSTATYGNSTTITVTTADGGRTATCTVTAGILVTGITVTPTTRSLSKGSDFDITDNILPSGATNQNVTWSSSNTAVATVNSSGTVMGVGAGTATITVTTVDGGYTATCVVTVTVPVTGVTLTPSTLLLDRSATYALVKTIAPSDATNQNVTWASSNTAVATVDANGVVSVKSTAALGGTTTITVTTVDGGRTDSCLVTVRTPVTGVTLTPDTKTLTQGTNFNLSAVVSPGSASNPAVTWTSSNPAVATVNGTGTVTAVSGGTATITVTTVDGGHSDTCVVTVPLYATNISDGNRRVFTVTFNKPMLSASISVSGTNIVVSGNQITFRRSSDFSNNTNIPITVIAADGTTKNIVVKRSSTNWSIVTP